MAELITATYPRRISDWLKHETDWAISRDNIILASGQAKVATGTVLGKITASGKYVVCDRAATDGSEDPDAILLRYTDATSADQTCVAVVGFAEVALAELKFHASFDTLAKKKTAMETLAAKHIKSRGIA